MCALLLVASEKITAALAPFCHSEARRRRDGAGGREGEREGGMDYNSLKALAQVSVSSFGLGILNRNASS